MDDRIQVEIEGAGERTDAEQPDVRRSGIGGVINLLLVVPAIGFIAFGVAIILWEEVLRYTVAFMFFLVGVGLLVAARKVGRVRKKAAAFKARFTGSGGWGSASGS